MSLRAFYSGVEKDEITALKYPHDLGVLPYARTICELKRNESVRGAKMYMGERKISSGVEKPKWRCTRNRCNIKRPVRELNAFFTYTKSDGESFTTFNSYCLGNCTFLSIYNAENQRLVTQYGFE